MDGRLCHIYHCVAFVIALSTLQILPLVNGAATTSTVTELFNEGKIETPTCSGQFLGNISVKWNLYSTLPSCGVSLRFDDFYLENDKDALYLYEGTDITQVLHSVYKGNQTSTQVYLRTQSAQLKFSCRNTSDVVRFSIAFTRYLMTTTMPTTTVNIELINECNSSPCANGNCTDELNAFRCTCNEGFSGSTCEQDIDECTTTPCLNGGVCTNTPGSYVCSCQAGFEGKSCERDVNECSHSPCVNGNCTNLPGTYTCHCHDGYSGQNCSQKSPTHVHIPAVSSALAFNQTMGNCNCPERHFISDDGRVPWYFVLLAVILSIIVTAIWFFCCYMKLLEIRREQQLQKLGLKSYSNHGFSTITLSATT